MKYQFFAIPAIDPAAEQDALNAFCASHRVVSVDRQVVIHDGQSYWAVCVSWQDGAAPRAERGEARRERIDYREVLSKADFAVYAALRELRKGLAEREGIPAYALFTNEQLAAMVTARCIPSVQVAPLRFMVAECLARWLRGLRLAVR